VILGFVVMAVKLLIQLIPFLAHLAALWVKWHERKILRYGVPLSESERADAIRMGVENPERIRLLKVERIPLLNGVVIQMLDRLIPSVSANTIGLSLRYGIYVRSAYWRDRRLIAHECVHTGQYERHRSVAAFLQAYFTGCIEMGYPAAPLEQEAIQRSAELGD
jgi:hypothetical protein